MHQFLIKLSACIILLSILIFSCQQKNITLPFFTSAELYPEWINENEVGYSKIHQIANFSFINQNGETITNENFDTKIYVSNFFFTTCPSICPTMTENMLKLQQEFLNEENIILVSHTVTPWIDTVQQLKKYSIEQGIMDDKWHLLTGNEEEIYKLARKSYFVDGKIGLQINDDEFLHTENFILIDGLRRIRGLYNGTIETDVNRLIEDIKILIEKS